MRPMNKQSHTSAAEQSETESGDTTHGYVQDKQKLVTRMRRIKGQVQAIESMIENDTYCIDVLTQISAATSALNSVSMLLLEDHLNSCVTKAAQQGGPVAQEKMDEAITAISRLVKA